MSEEQPRMLGIPVTWASNTWSPLKTHHAAVIGLEMSPLPTRMYRARNNGWYVVWWILFLLLLTFSGSTCLQDSPNHVPTIISGSVHPFWDCSCAEPMVPADGFNVRAMKCIFFLSNFVAQTMKSYTARSWLMRLRIGHRLLCRHMMVKWDSKPSQCPFDSLN